MKITTRIFSGISITLLFAGLAGASDAELYHTQLRASWATLHHQAILDECRRDEQVLDSYNSMEIAARQRYSRKRNECNDMREPQRTACVQEASQELFTTLHVLHQARLEEYILHIKNLRDIDAYWNRQRCPVCGAR